MKFNDDASKWIAIVSTLGFFLTPAANAQIEEIVVTAQKRAESSQSVPVSLTAFTGEAMEAQNIVSVEDLDRFAPGLTVSQSDPSRTRLRIRGIGSRKFDVGADPSVGTFVDEVYIPRFSGVEFNLLEVERLEVLKGPQGTIFGRNTPAGAISVITGDPADEFEGYLEGGLGNKSSYLARGSVSGPISERVRASFSYGEEERGGFASNALTGASEDTLSRAARLKFLFEPQDDFRITTTVQYTELEADAVLGHSLPTIPGDLTAPTLGPVSPTTTDAFNVLASEDGFIDTDAILGILRVEKDFGDYTLTSVTGYRDSELTLLEDLEQLAVDVARTSIFEDSQTFSEELRFAGPNFVVGLFYYDDDAFRSDSFNLGPASAPFGPPFFVPPGTAQIDAALVDIETTSWAVFGQYEFDLSDALTLTVGARYSDDNKEYTLAATTLPPIGPPIIGAPPVFGPYSLSDELNFDSFDPKVTLDYAINDEALVYFNYSQGYKSGGVQFTAFSPALAERTFDPENVDAYEIGLKSDWLDGSLRVNAALFFYDYEDLQQQRVEIVGGAPAAVTSNAATAEIRGAEIDVTLAASENLLFRFAYAYTDAEFQEFIVSPGPPALDASGNSLPASPEHTLFGSVSYDQDFSNQWSMNLGLDWYWTDEQFFDVFENDPFTREDSYSNGQIRAGFNSPEDRFGVIFFVENVTDEFFYDQRNRRGGEVIAAPADGRRFGARFRYSFR